MYIDEHLVAAPATPFLLTVLSEGESHGFAVVERLREQSGGDLGWPDGMVYPLFHRLHRLGYLTTEWRTLPDGRRRRYYALTDDGRAALITWQSPWVRAAGALNRVTPDPWRLQIASLVTSA